MLELANKHFMEEDIFVTYEYLIDLSLHLCYYFDSKLDKIQEYQYFVPLKCQISPNLYLKFL